MLVARPSKWGNPFRPAREEDRPAVLRKYLDHLLRELRAGRLDPEELRGKDLACYCAPKPCHAELLLALANMTPRERARRVAAGTLPDPWAGRRGGAEGSSPAARLPAPMPPKQRAPRRSPRRTPSVERVEVRNINAPGHVRQLEKPKYEAMRRALLKALPRKAPGLTQREMVAKAKGHLPQDLFPHGEKAEWWAKSVQLDLEARGVVVREATRPLRWHRA